MLKGQLSKVTLVTKHLDAVHFPALWALQQPHKHSHSLLELDQLAIHTKLVHHYIQYAL